MKNQIINQTFDEERSLYNLNNASVINCKFQGPADGESVLKECRNFIVEGSTFSLRYPMWHAKHFKLLSSIMDDKTRAPIWYAKNGEIFDCQIYGIKCLRECSNIVVNNCKIVSPEFGWKCKNLHITNSIIDSMYFLFGTKNVEIQNLEMTGKYSFQYMKNLRILNSKLDTKDAFWHSKNITVENSLVKGEYLGWFSDGLTLINCHITGTQPLCYCKNLKLINCTMENTDLAFEYSDVEADIKGHILSVKNPRSGTVTADSVGEIIRKDAVMDCSGEVKIRNQALNL